MPTDRNLRTRVTWPLEQESLGTKMTHMTESIKGEALLLRLGLLRSSSPSNPDHSLPLHLVRIISHSVLLTALHCPHTYRSARINPSYTRIRTRCESAFKVGSWIPMSCFFADRCRSKCPPLPYMTAPICHPNGTDIAPRSVNTKTMEYGDSEESIESPQASPGRGRGDHQLGSV